MFGIVTRRARRGRARQRSGVFILEVKSGRPLQVLFDGEGLGPILDVFWLNIPAHIFVKHSGGNGASIYSIT